jgi:hypothetical protein
MTGETAVTAEAIEQALRARFADCDLRHPLTEALFRQCLARAWRRAGVADDPVADRH